MSRDPVWEYATKENKRFRCKFCNGDFYGSAIRLKYHLAQEQHGNIRKCSEVPADVKSKCSQMLRERATSSSMARIEENGEEKVELRKSIVQFFRSRGLPLTLVEDPVFINMFCAIKHHGAVGVPSKEDLQDMEMFMVSDDDDGDDWD